MGESRKCGARCHNAKHPKCSCWCGGLFHGAAGQRARDVFVETFGEPIPADGQPVEDLFHSGERFMRALEKARESHGT